MNNFKNMVNVFILQHVHEFGDDRKDVKIIGIYSTKTLAEAAKAIMLSQPGFIDAPEGFHISCYPLDKDQWIEGYFTVYYSDS